jgi:hypothetical protein
MVAAVACGPSVATLRSPSQLAPADLYSCVVRELARLEYSVLQADRDAGLVKAERKASGTGTALFTGAAYYNEITALVLPPTDSTPAELRLTLVRSKQEGSRQRTSTGMVVTRDLQTEGAAVQKACAPAGN